MDELGIPIQYHKVATTPELEECLEKIYQAEATRGVPALHFECHGWAEGIDLADGSTYAWTTLSNQLVRFNRASGFHTLAAFSCCEGISQITSVTSGKCCPFAALVGCDDTIKTFELLEGFAKFYPTLVKTRDGATALAILQAEVKVSRAKFGLPTAESVFMGALQKVYAENADRTLLAARVATLRATIDAECARKGMKNPFTDAALTRGLLEQESVTVRHFYEAFFDIGRIPANNNRYDYGTMTAIARKGLAPMDLM